jgi:integrase
MVTIPAHISKTKKRTRHIELSDNAIAWLRLTGEHAPTQKVLQSDYFQLYRRMSPIWKRAGEGRKWIHQGMRHSYCSYWLNAYHDQNKLQRMSGHATPEMLDEYLRGGTQAEALKFWQIMPPVG